MTYDRMDWERIGYTRIEEKYSRVNLIDDGGFESGTKEYWTAVEHCSWENQKDDVYSSKYAAKITIDAEEYGIFLNNRMIEAYPSMPFMISFNYKNDANITNIYYYIAFYDEQGNLVSYETVAVELSTDSWSTFYDANITATAQSYAYVRFGIMAKAGTSAGTLYLDNFVVPSKRDINLDEYGSIGIATGDYGLLVRSTYGVGVFPDLTTHNYDKIQFSYDADDDIEYIYYKLGAATRLTLHFVYDAEKNLTAIERS